MQLPKEKDKRTNNDLQNIIQKTNYCATWIPPKKAKCELRCSGSVSSSYPTKLINSLHLDTNRFNCNYSIDVWLSEYHLTPDEQFNFAAISWREQVLFWWLMMSVLYYNATRWVSGNIAEATVCGHRCRSTRRYYSDSKPTSLCS
jgi:hypothetical protein